MGCHSSKDHTQPKRFQPIPDRFTSISQVQHAVREAGLESSNLIIGVDFTRSNEWTGRRTFAGRCLHSTSHGPNPYQQVISVVGRTLEEFDDDRLIPAFGFGDENTGAAQCFPFFEERPSHGVDEVLTRYKEIAETVNLAGPTCFAPVIREAINIVREEQSYHILVIIADGQVSNKSPSGETAKAIIEASHYPLSIIVVGVGDGPWGTMEHYDDELPERKFDNFQFVDFNAVRVSASYRSEGTMEAKFALTALMEIPDQYAFIKENGLLDSANFPKHSPRAHPLAAAPPLQAAPVLPLSQMMKNTELATPALVTPNVRHAVPVGHAHVVAPAAEP